MSDDRNDDTPRPTEQTPETEAEQKARKRSPSRRSTSKASETAKSKAGEGRKKKPPARKTSRSRRSSASAGDTPRKTTPKRASKKTAPKTAAATAVTPDRIPAAIEKAPTAPDARGLQIIDGVPTQITDQDIFLFNEGTHYRLYDKFGARPLEHEGTKGTFFAVWAPNAGAVSVIGDFNDWDKEAWYLRPRGNSGIWEGFIPEIAPGAHYKYHIRSAHSDYAVDKADPFGFMHERPPRTGSIVTSLDYDWNDDDWMKNRKQKFGLDAAVSAYEMHIGSWMRVPEEDGRSLTYRELAPKLTEYLKGMGFSHVEFMPVMEHPFYGSWGYQVTGFFAPTSRHGTPQDFMYLIDYLHQNDIGVIVDWVPSHFPSDEHGLSYFDGTHLYEHADPRQGYHPDWNSYIFNYGRNEVRSFLSSSAAFWIDKFHVDGLRVDAVASMLYLDYSRKEGEWIPNEYGGRENIDAINFLRRLNSDLYRDHPDIQTIAEESTAWPMVSRPTYLGGLGFGMKWDMGWMHDTLSYMSKDPIFRAHHHNALTFRLIYAYTENFMLPLSHDEVVHGKGSLLGKMPGDDWQKFANLRLLYSYMWAQPGKKLLFMGGEIAQRAEWNHDGSLEWHLLEHESHRGIQKLVSDLNSIYREHAPLHAIENDPSGFEWIDANDSAQSVISFMRKDQDGNVVIAVFNFTPMPRRNYLVGTPLAGFWREIFNSDAGIYGGSGMGNLGRVETAPVQFHGRRNALTLTLPPLGAIFLVHER